MRRNATRRGAEGYRLFRTVGWVYAGSVAAVGLRQEPTGVATAFNADVVATAKRDLQPGEVLDGEGGYTVFGKLAPAKTSLARGYLPLGLAHSVKLVRPVAKDQPLTWADVAIDQSLAAYKIRNEMEALYGADLEMVRKLQ